MLLSPPGDAGLCHVDKTIEHRSWRLIRINDFILLESSYPISKWLVLHIQLLHIHAGKHIGSRQTLCYLHILLKYAHIQMAVKPFPKPSLLEHMGPLYNQEHVPHETQGWCAPLVLREVNGRLMSEWNMGICGGNLNLCIKIPIIAVTPILNLSNKIPYGVSVPYGTEARGLLGPLLSLSITLIDRAPHTALLSGQSFCLLLCLEAFSSASDQCPGWYQQL